MKELFRISTQREIVSAAGFLIENGIKKKQKAVVGKGRRIYSSSTL